MIETQDLVAVFESSAWMQNTDAAPKCKAWMRDLVVRSKQQDLSK